MLVNVVDISYGFMAVLRESDCFKDFVLLITALQLVSRKYYYELFRSKCC